MDPRRKTKYRTHTCGELRANNENEVVTLSGWIHRKRDHGGVVFVDLRDHYGVTQIVASGQLGDELQKIRVESVIQVTGNVLKRTPELVNKKLETGEIELHITALSTHSEAEVLPFLIADPDNASEPLRLKYRFLELRRDELHKNIMLRSQVIRSVRSIMFELGFQEFQTPILTSSSPEGARDFLVPSRLHPGKFFALPQAPQQFKQLLMVSGFDRYFQIAPCFRDEDPRADRSPGEFYQCDLEMSFVEQDDVLQVAEQLFEKLFTEFANGAAVTKAPFPRITYANSMEWYGNDKPDLRIPVKMKEVTSVFKDTTFKIFRNELDGGSSIVAAPFPVKEVPSRKYFDDTIAWFQGLSGKGVGYLIFEQAGVKGSIAKFFTEDEIASLKEALALSGDTTHVVFLGAGQHQDILSAMGKLRVRVGTDVGLLEKDVFKFCFVTDYPMYERDSTTGEIGFSHNPFSMPQGGLEALLTKKPLDILANQYDVVCNGYELSSGAIRNHSPETMYKAFEIAGYSKEQVDDKFGGMIRAFQFGAPPHGGMAPGIDRIVMLLANKETIRDVITFPLSQACEDLMMGAPSEVTFKQLRELHIRSSVEAPVVVK